MEDIFTSFGDIQKQAVLVKDNTSDNIAGSNCYKISNSILEFNAYNLKDLIITKAKKAFKFLYESRRGFYCSICDARAQKFFDKSKNVITMSASFCGDIIKETMNFFIFKYQYFMKISRLYQKFLVNCDLRGKFNPKKFIRHDVKFFRKKEILMDIKNCKVSLHKPRALEFCASYCSRFNPVVYNKYFEGELDKLSRY